MTGTTPWALSDRFPYNSEQDTPTSERARETPFGVRQKWGHGTLGCFIIKFCWTASLLPNWGGHTLKPPNQWGLTAIARLISWNDTWLPAQGSSVYINGEKPAGRISSKIGFPSMETDRKSESQFENYSSKTTKHPSTWPLWFKKQ